MSTTVFWTIFAGAVVFIVGQFFQRIFLEPIQEQRKNVSRIAQALTVHRNAVLHKSSYAHSAKARKKIDVTSARLRKLAGDLRAGYSLIPFNDVFAFIKLVPNHDTVRMVALYLIRWPWKPGRF